MTPLACPRNTEPSELVLVKTHPGSGSVVKSYSLLQWEKRWASNIKQNIFNIN